MQRMKINILRTILIILLMVTFFMIFNFSNQNGEKSGSLSMEVTQTVTKDIKTIQELDENKKEQVLTKIEKVIRKLAHFSLYTLVGLLLMSLMSTYNLEQKKRVLLSLIVGVTYASSDEFHQMFVSGRTPQVTDVMIDSMGVMFGIALIILGLKIWRKMETENSTKNVEKLNK